MEKMEIRRYISIVLAALADRRLGEESVIRADKAAVPGDKTRLLGHVIVPDHVGVQSLLIALHVVTHHDLFFPGQWPAWPANAGAGSILHRFVQAEAFRWVRLRHRGEGGRQPGICQPLSPATVLDLPSFQVKALASEWASKCQSGMATGGSPPDAVYRAHPGIARPGTPAAGSIPPSPRPGQSWPAAIGRW